MDLFSKRHRKQTQETFQYDLISEKLRYQVIHIWADAIGPYFEHRLYATLGYDDPRLANGIWREIERRLLKEKGLPQLGTTDNPYTNCEQFLLESTTVEDALDVIQLSFACIDIFVRPRFEAMLASGEVSQSPDDAIADLNRFFQESGVGYQFAGGQIIRVDSLYTHEEITKPALQLLSATGFDGPLDEFLNAHEHYRKGETKAAIVDAANALESTMKTICDKRGWTYSRSAQSGELVSVLGKHGLIPDYAKPSFNGLASLRNQCSATHGQGAKPVTIPLAEAELAVNLAATNIVFLVSSHKRHK